MRTIKDDNEIAKIRRACEITDNCFTHLLEYIKVGMTERQIAFEIEKYFIENGANGLASHLEIRMFGVTRSQRQKGFGRSMLQSILDATPGHKVEASCLPASVVMARMLTNAGFHVKEISPFGKRTFRR